MPLDQTIQAIIEEYGTTLWLGFVTLVVTGFVLATLKGFVEDLIYYVRARMSDIGYSQRIYYNNEIYLVRSIHFKYIIIYDDKKVIRIPTKSYLNGPIVFPQPRYDDFNEKKYHEPPWDGKRERRDRPSPTPPPPGPPPNPKTPNVSHFKRSGDCEIDYIRLRRDLVDILIGILISPEAAENIFPSFDDDKKEEVDRVRGKLTEYDFNNINSGLAAFLRMNTEGTPLTKAEIDAARKLSECDEDD
jgi:hypothetical protein